MAKMVEVLVAIFKEINAVMQLKDGHSGRTSAQEWIQLFWITREKVGGSFSEKQPGP